MNMTKIQAWLASKNITTQTVGALLVTFAIAYSTSSTVRDQIATLFLGYPAAISRIGIITGDIVILSALWAKFSHSSSPAGTIATAQVLLASPNVPTKAEVRAATINPNLPIVPIVPLASPSKEK